MIKKTLVENSNENRYNIRVLDRAFRILALLSDGKSRTLQKLSEEIDLSTSTTFRLLATLTHYQYIQREEQTNLYTLGLACLGLTRAYYEGNILHSISLPELTSLRNETKETVHLAILDQLEIVYIDKLQGLYAIGLMGSSVGGRSPAYCTGVGKVLLAYEDSEFIKQYFLGRKFERYTDNTITSYAALVSELTLIHSQGYALDHEEHENEVCCVAAPIFDIRGDVIAALSISGPANRMEPIERNQDIIEKAKRTANNISVKLGYSF